MASIQVVGLSGFQAALARYVEKAGGYSAAARQIPKATPSLLCDVIAGRRRPTPNVVEAIGWRVQTERRVIYERGVA